ncbi:hypothetical protein GBAR_LOCUS22508 [Geodia barretti]|uniref:Uncharacterized protein n=1 Tax=Geodia barretti TaxID=519541 RepID=A0AA35X173_GEOBA|nr:hypothetical protein GBAR_LOCUS22508 [Geodia barretti]
MIALALRLHPDLDPAAIVDPQPRDITPPELPAPAEPADTTAWTSSLVVSQLLRLASAFLAHDADAIVSMLDGSVYVAGMNVTRAQAHAALDALFQRRSLAGISLAQIYDTDSVMAQPYDMGAGALADAFQVSMDARLDLSADVPFWGTDQRFVLRPAGNSWLISAILFSDAQQLPASWSPAPMESATAAEQRMRAAATRKRDMGGADGGCASVAGRRRPVPGEGHRRRAGRGRQPGAARGRRVGDAGVAASYADRYFGSTPYRGLRAGDIITVGSVEPLGSGDERVYRAEVSFEDRYQEALPSIPLGAELRSAGR